MNGGRRKNRPRRRRTTAGTRAAFALSALCFAVLSGSMLFAASCYERSANCTPNPASANVQDEDGFPFVDWAYWQEVNPDVIGWITVPGTPLDYPIVQAPQDDPGYYLTHDVYRTWNFAGCPYLDAGCAEGGLTESQNALVFAHNLGHGDTSLFATVAQYGNGQFAQAHRTVLVQTPDSKRACLVKGVACIPGHQATKRTSFSDDGDFHAWLSERMAECSIVLDGAEAQPSRILTLCTCSYGIWEDERTLVYASRGD